MDPRKKRGSARWPLLLALGVAALGCAPTSIDTPCNADDDCERQQACLRGSCTPTSPRLVADAGARDADGGPRADASVPIEDDAGVEGGDAGPEDAGEAPLLDGGLPGILSFVASPASVDLGQAVTLSWEGHLLSGCALEGHPEGLPPSGSLVLARPASRPYALRCVDVLGGQHEAEVVVTVSCAVTLSLASLTIASEEDMPFFTAGECVTVTGDVSISNVTSLMRLYGLTEVGGSLNIGGNPGLTSLDGLETLASIGDDLRLGVQLLESDPVQANPQLESLHGLSALSTVGLDLEIFEQNALVSLAGLERLVSIGSDLELHDNAALTSLVGLRRLESIAADLEVFGHASLSSLDGLDALAVIGSAIIVKDNTALADISALGGVGGELRSIHIGNNQALVSLAGLEGVTGLRQDLTLESNAALVSLAGLANLRYAERVYVRSNASLKDADLPSLEAVEYTGPQTCVGTSRYCDGSITFYNNDSLLVVEGFASLTTLQTDLHIVYNDLLLSVSAFGGITNMQGVVRIANNPALQSVTGLSQLTRIDDLYISDNAFLQELDLSSLAHIVDDINFANNDACASLEGLAGLDIVGGDLIIENNASLSALGLASLFVAGDYPACSYGCLFHVRDNPSLPSEEAANLAAQAGRPAIVGDEPNVVLTGNGP